MYSKHTCVVHFCMVFPIFYHTNFWRTGPKFDQGLSLVQVSSSLVEIRKFSVRWSVWGAKKHPIRIWAMSCLGGITLGPEKSFWRLIPATFVHFQWLCPGSGVFLRRNWPKVAGSGAGKTFPALVWYHLKDKEMTNIYQFSLKYTIPVQSKRHF